MRVLISGIFDLFHYGHMVLIRKCRELYPNDTLIVGVHADKDCENYKRKPVLTFEERKKSIEIFGVQDEVIACPVLETEEFYKDNKIDSEKINHIGRSGKNWYVESNKSMFENYIF